MEPVDVRPTVLARQVDLLYDHLPGGLAVNSAVTLALWLWIAGPSRSFLWDVWASIGAAVSVLRLAGLLRYRRARPLPRDARGWLHLFAAGATAQALLWGVVSLLSFPTLAPVDQLFVVIVLCAMAGGAVIFLSPVWGVYVLYVLPTLLPASVELLMRPSATERMAGALGLVYTGAMVYTSLSTNRWIAGNTELSFKKEALAEYLHAANVELERYHQQFQRSAERALRESEGLYRSLFDNTLNGVAHCQMVYEHGQPSDFVYLDVNRAFETLTGLKGVIGKPVSAVIPGVRASDPELFALYDRVATTGSPERCEQYVAALGQWFSISAYSPSSGHFVAVFDVITERKQAEARLRASEAKFRSYIEHAPMGVFVLDRAGRFVEVNDAAAAMIGYTQAEFLQRELAGVFAPGSVDDGIRAFQALATEGERRGEFLCRRKDGSEFWAAVSAVRLGGDRFIAFSHDLTPRRKAEQALRESEDRLRASQKMEAIGALAGGVAHDFNNLLTVIDGYARFALDSLGDGDPLHADLIEIRSAAERAARLTRQLLAFGRKQVLVPRVINLNDIIAGMESMLRRLIGEDVEIVTKIATNLGNVKADPGQIEQVVMNLAVNARDAMPSGGTLLFETANVDLDEAYGAQHPGVQPGAYVRFSVTDTGCGMDPQTSARIFELFFTTKERGKGTGLGLSTVYGIVTQSGGNIWVYSEPGHGTTFGIDLPRTESVADAAALPNVEAVRQPEPRDVGGATILLVEDEEAVRKLAKRTLDRAGYRVLTAADGHEALELCDRLDEPVHLLVTDLIMPRMGGRDLAERLAARRSDLKVLFTSGYTENAVVHNGALGNGAHFIAKPFSMRDLRAKVGEVLSNPDAPETQETLK
jgi:PAS domain S-box-containing protein